MKLKKRMILRKIFRAVGIGTALLAAAVALFIAVSWAVEYRPGERETTICCPEGEIVPLPDTLTILSWNIGYAGLGDNMDFFYDGGRRVRDSRERTARNLKEIVETISRVNPDIALLQEVDLDSRRSYRIREVDTLRAAFPGYTLAFAYNYKVCWVPVPLRAPLGRVQAGVVTLSRYAPVSTVRYGYPSAFGFPVRLFNLKRCLLEAEFVTRGGDTVWIGNTHNTAYDTGGMRSDEMRFLGELLRAASLRGVRSVTGGDWNQYPPGYEPSEEELSNRFFVPQAVDSSLIGPGFRFAYDPARPTLRYLNRPYVPSRAGMERPTTTLTDFFLLSGGIRVLSVETLPLGFRSSDHDPVLLRIAWEREADARRGVFVLNNSQFVSRFRKNVLPLSSETTGFQIKKAIIRMNVPDHLKYSKDHEWIRVEGDEAYVGITDFAQSQLGDIVFVDVTTVGETLAQNDVFGTIEAVKTVSDAFLPVSGEVLEFNESLNDAPDRVNADPYGEGWIVKIRMSDPSELGVLLSADDYAKLIG